MAVAAAPRVATGRPYQLPGLIALAGGVLAVATGWLPWETFLGVSLNPMDSVITERTSDLANGYYLVGAGALAAFCGLVLLLASVRTRNTAALLGLGAIVGGALVLAVEGVAYSDMADSVKLGASVGYGLYLGVAGGAIAIVGGLFALVKKP
jgi:hypothetical protein